MKANKCKIEQFVLSLLLLQSCRKVGKFKRIVKKLNSGGFTNINEKVVRESLKKLCKRGLVLGHRKNYKDSEMTFYTLTGTGLDLLLNLEKVIIDTF